VAAHELRTPIMPIIGVTDLIKERFFEYDSKNKNNKDNNNNTNHNIQRTIKKEELDIIIRNCMRLQQLAEDVLATSRIESNSLQLHKEKFSLNNLVWDILRDIKVNASRNIDGITDSGSHIIVSNKTKFFYESNQFNTNTNTNTNRYNGNDNSSDIIVYADKQMIGQVIFNLLSNSTKFTKSGKISVAVRLQKSKQKENYDDKFEVRDGKNNCGQEAVVRIRDTGAGIDPEIFPKLFSKFATKSNYKGTGLGLFISKNIVEAHGGKIWAENNSEGRGATFTFSLPVCSQS